MASLPPAGPMGRNENAIMQQDGLCFVQHKRGADAYYQIQAPQDQVKRIRSLSSVTDVKILSARNQPDVRSKQAADVSEPSTPPQGAEQRSHYQDDVWDLPSLEEAFCHLSVPDQEYLRSCLEREATSTINAGYLQQVQYDVDGHKRLVLVDWMVEVVDEFSLSQETLFLAVSLLDRFLSVRCVCRAQLQLLGVTCLWVASKYDEVSPPVLADFVEITDNSYRPSDLIAMEGLLLQVLGFELGAPTAVHFLQQYLAQFHRHTGAVAAAALSRQAAGSPSQHASPTTPASQQVAHLAEYFLELALLTPEALRYRPSLVAATALQMAVCMLEQPDMTLLCMAVTGGASTQVRCCIRELASMHEWAAKTCKAPAVADKYGHRARSCVSRLPAEAVRDLMLL